MCTGAGHNSMARSPPGLVLPDGRARLMVVAWIAGRARYEVLSGDMAQHCVAECEPKHVLYESLSFGVSG